MANKKLIEVALPLEAINTACEREKSIRHGHPSSLHLWWARRPLAATRAVIWASLVDDPSSHPEIFSTEEEQMKERMRLFSILEKLVIWENSNDDLILDAAKKEILKSTGNNPPVFLDPFAGGGAIPLEAQRLGLVANAHDLNPVAVMINKAMIEIPPLFSGHSPVNPRVMAQIGMSENIGWENAAGLAEDVRYYGEWIRDEAFKRVGHLYPEINLPSECGGGKATIIAWLWARTGKCPNPACGCDMPLVTNYAISKKKGHEAWVEPYYEEGKLCFNVHKGKCPTGKESSKVGRGGVFRCPRCGELTTDQYLKEEGKANRIAEQMMAIVADGPKGRVYLPASIEQQLLADVSKPEEYPDGVIPTNPRWFSPPAFGMTNFSDIFSNRQLLTLSTFSTLIPEVQKVVEKDALNAGMKNDHISIADKGDGARAYGEAVSIYLAFLIDQMANQASSINGWNSINQQMISLFSRQAMPMVWDHAECNIFSNSSGSFNSLFDRMIKAFSLLGQGVAGEVEQIDAQSDCGMRNIMVSTDPPYYDNIGYSDLSDFFYIWMRNSLKSTFPSLFATMVTPKAEELIATPCRHNGSVELAKDFFEDGMKKTCSQFYKYVNEDIPLTIYYAYKQSEADVTALGNRRASSGWETMLTSIISSGFSITGTWPIRTETVAKLKANVNALASSIVLVCRKRPEDAPQTTKKNLVNALRRELRPALKKLQDSNIAPVDLAQSAIGPGMGVFSQYKRVLEADGTPMSVRSALQIINEEIDLYFNEQVGSMDTASRFCVDLYTQCAYNDIKYGEAEFLANAKGTSIPMMASHGVLYAKAGVVHLMERENLPEKVDSNESNIWMLTQQLTRAMATGGVEACAHIVFNMFGSNAENAKDLAYRLYTIAERKGWANEAYAYNALVVAWPDIQTKAAELKAVQPEQMSLFDLGLMDKK